MRPSRPYAALRRGTFAAGLRRVVTTIEDPDPRVAGRGHAMLRAAGIEVTTGVLAEEARRDLDGFLSRITRRCPHVMLKLAMSSDGMITAERGRPTAITGELASGRVHLMRARADAIMVGVSRFWPTIPHSPVACRAWTSARRCAW